MKNYMQWIVLSFTSFLAMGCTLIPEHVSLNPSVYQGGAENIGHGQVVALNVIDGRSQKSVGNRPSGFGPMASVSLGNDPAQAIYAAVSNGLNARGFKTVSYLIEQHAPKLLTITLRQLGYEQKASVMSLSVLVHTSIGADAEHNHLHYQKVYRAEQTNNYLIVPMTVQDETLINKVLSDNINRMFLDKNLMAFLAK